ncbi:MAG: Gfo/Idh/MocA family oxidoreductase, partial [Spirochaetia bacterium]|nr:Gfo/Idh/MocA family oxidoreductase [Spirochaetia bacterium]
CGRISHKHIEAFARNAARMQLVAVCDPLLDRAQTKSREYLEAMVGVRAIASVSNAAAPKVYADYRRMLEELKPDIVTIATESGYHPRIAIDCLSAGAHVICEKPIALSTIEADAMIEAAKENGRKLALCFQNRFNAPVQKARKALEAGRFGELLHGMIQVRWNRNDNYYAQAPWRGTWALDGGTLMNQCTHGIDLLQWMMGENAVRVQAVTRRFVRPIEAEDYGAAIVEFASGAVGVIEGTACVHPTNLNETLSLFGTKGTVVIGGLATNKLETWRFADAEEYGDTEDKALDLSVKDPPSVYGYGHGDLFADVLDSIETGSELLVSGERGRKALEIILAIYKAQKTGLPVDLPCHYSTAEMAESYTLPGLRS